jgi:hypothetical protein
MPFGTKPAEAGRTIDFDAVYQQILAPAIAAAGMDPLRADEEQVGGVIHKPMFERLVLCPYAVADLTTGNANVAYELGVRHAVRPWRTVIAFADGTRLPFDVAPLRGLPYRLGADGKPDAAHVAADRQALTTRLRQSKDAATDSPLFQLLDGMSPPDVSRLKTDVFRDRVDYSRKIKAQVQHARAAGVAALGALERELAPIRDQEFGVVVDLFLSYRAVKAWDAMIALVDAMHPALASTVMVREQQALALNRAGRSEEAEALLRELTRERGPSSETLGILGRVYKDRWEKARSAGNAVAAQGWLHKAIDAYLRGFEADSRDAYPGVNALTLMEIADDPRRTRLLPVVTYAVETRMKHGQPDYWDYATLLELAVLERDEARARVALRDCVIHVREVWEPETTLRNLALIESARQARGAPTPWLRAIEDALRQRGTRGP